MSNLNIRKVAVLGAGVMGAQIAAHLVNAGVPVLLFDLPAKEGDPNGIVLKAIENLQKLEPAPLGVQRRASYIEPANYDNDSRGSPECDLVIEAIAERMDWKRDLYEKVAPHIAARRDLRDATRRDCRSPRCRTASRTRCARASAACTSSIRRATCIWSELIPPRDTDPDAARSLETFLTSRRSARA